MRKAGYLCAGIVLFVGPPALIAWGVLRYRSILIPVALGAAIILFASAVCGALAFWLGSRRRRILVLVGVIFTAGTIMDGVHTLGHDWSTLDSLNLIVNVISWSAYLFATVLGFLAGLSKRAADKRLPGVLESSACSERTR